MADLLELKDLKVEYPTRFGLFQAITGIELKLEPGEIHGLVGESGAGKSTIGAAIMGLIPSPGYIANGDILFNGINLCFLKLITSNIFKEFYISFRYTF